MGTNVDFVIIFLGIRVDFVSHFTILVSVLSAQPNSTMRVFLLLAVTIASGCAVSTDAIVLDKISASKRDSEIQILSRTAANLQTKRFLRTYDDVEERAGGLDKLDDALSKLSLKQPKLSIGWSTPGLGGEISYQPSNQTQV
ncbi:unnamed protein product [Phytophthora lilii]|uniref:RxLR effector protein n=1 Tax=Phytophthora lilii TaxID=2077276 RepID=A0A9W6U2D3_9STRA|nr:unnamed protein product [Phytophthora lilii]